MENIIDMREKLFVEIPVAERLYLLIHPFWQARDYRPEYTAKIDDLVANFEGPIVTLDVRANMIEGDEINNIFTIYERLNPKGSRYIVEGGMPAIAPLDIGWEGLADMIANAEQVIMGGSNLSGNEEIGYGQCLGIAYREMKKLWPDVELDINLALRLQHKT